MTHRMEMGYTANKNQMKNNNNNTHTVYLITFDYIILFLCYSLFDRVRLYFDSMRHTACKL